MIKLKIEGTGRTAKVYADGVEIKGITKYELIHEALDIPEIKLTLIADEIDVDTHAIPELPDIYKKFYKRIDEPTI